MNFLNIRYLWLVAAAILILLLIGVLSYRKAGFVPEEFMFARRESAKIAKVIVGNTEASLKNLDEIALYDQRSLFEFALVLVRQELDRTQESRRQAASLAQELNKMTAVAGQVQPAKNRELALAAISDELLLISKLMVYNDVLHSLLRTLEYKFSGDIRYDANDVQVLVKNMNQIAKEVNQLNESFNEKMRRLDKMAGLLKFL